MQTTRQSLHEQLCQSCRESALTYAKRLVRNIDDAEDIVQEALIRVMGSIHDSNLPNNPKAWLFTAVRNTFIDRHRAARRRPEVVSLNAVLEVNASLEPTDHRSTPEQLFLESELGPEIAEAFAKIDEADRMALLEAAGLIEPTPGQRDAAYRVRKFRRVAAARRRFIEQIQPEPSPLRGVAA